MLHRSTPQDEAASKNMETIDYVLVQKAERLAAVNPRFTHEIGALTVAYTANMVVFLKSGNQTAKHQACTAAERMRRLVCTFRVVGQSSERTD